MHNPFREIKRLWNALYNVAEENMYYDSKTETYRTLEASEINKRFEELYDLLKVERKTTTAVTKLEKK